MCVRAIQANNGVSLMIEREIRYKSVVIREWEDNGGEDE